MDEHPDMLQPLNYRAFATAIPTASSKMAPYQPFVATASLNADQRLPSTAQGGERANVWSQDQKGARDLLTKGASEKQLLHAEHG